MHSIIPYFFNFRQVLVKLTFQFIFHKKRISLCLLLFLGFILFAQNPSSRATITGVVSDQFGFLPGSKIIIEGTNLVTTTDINGAFSLPVNEGDHVVTASFVMYKTQSTSLTVKVGETATVYLTLETNFLIDEPVSIGTRAAPTSLLDTSVPIDIISNKALNNSSELELGQVLQYLIPSFHSTHQTISDGTDHIDPATLRGLSPDQILVLINGKRRHNSALLNVNGTVGKGTVGTDFNAIPLGAIDRIEVLRDGATSQYGSDAIAGVINIILKDQSDVIDIDSKAKINTEGDGVAVNFSANFGLKIGKKGFVNLTGDYKERGATNRSGSYTGNVYSNDPDEDAALISQNNFFSKTGYKNNRIMEVGSAETQNLTLFFNGEIPLSNTSGFYFNGGKNYREGIAKGFYRFPIDEDLVVLKLYPNGFSPEIHTDISDNSLTAGFNGTKNGWNLDFSHTIGSNSINYTINNSNNASLGNASPKTFYSGGFTYNQNTTNFNASKSYDWLFNVNIAFGGEIRVENYQIISGEEASYSNGGATYIDDVGIEQPKIPGVQVFPGIKPEDELSRFRTNSSGYVDIETNISKALLIKTALRYEAYNDFGGQLIGKLSSRYRLNKNLSLRAGYSTGFRAPSLHQVFFQSTSNQFINGELLPVGTFNNESALSEAFKIDKLKPELSRHFTMGFTGKFNKNWTYSFDYYNINIEDRIVLSGRFSEGYEDILQSFNVGAAQFFTNAIDSKTYGIDGSINYKRAFEKGEFNALIGANITKTKVIGPIKVNTTLANQEDVLFNREEIARVESAQPNFKINALTSYEWSKFKLNLVNTVFGKVIYLNANDELPINWVMNELTGINESRDQIFTPKLLTDLSFSFQVSDIFKIALGGNNIFNVYPDEHTHSSNINQGRFVYSRRVQQFGVNGANLFARLSMRL